MLCFCVNTIFFQSVIEIFILKVNFTLLYKTLCFNVLGFVISGGLFIGHA